jgi:glycine cleavage system H protein
MAGGANQTLFYKRSHFVAHLPVNALFTASHAWLARDREGPWRVGLTRFATRMLGDLVDHGFDTPPGTPIVPGQILGWVEGFKAISDLYGVIQGTFTGGNPALKEQLELLSKDPFGKGWLYAAEGQPDPDAMDVHAYSALLDKTIDRILEKQSGQDLT